MIGIIDKDWNELIFPVGIGGLLSFLSPLWEHDLFMTSPLLAHSQAFKKGTRKKTVARSCIVNSSSLDSFHEHQSLLGIPIFIWNNNLFESS